MNFNSVEAKYTSPDVAAIKRAEDVQKRAFTCAGLANDGQQIALSDGERDVFEEDEASAPGYIFLVQIFDANDFGGRVLVRRTKKIAGSSAPGERTPGLPPKPRNSP